VRGWTRPLLMVLAVVAHGGLWSLGFLETERFAVPPAVAGAITFAAIVSRVGALALGIAELGLAWRSAAAVDRRLVGWLFAVGLAGAGMTSVPMLVAAVEGRTVVEVLTAAWARWVWMGAAELSLLAVFAGLFVRPSEPEEGLRMLGHPVVVLADAPTPGRRACDRCGKVHADTPQGHAAHSRWCPATSKASREVVVGFRPEGG
jgi:hypothetical protein